MGRRRLLGRLLGPGRAPDGGRFEEAVAWRRFAGQHGLRFRAKRYYRGEVAIRGKIPGAHLVLERTLDGGGEASMTLRDLPGQPAGVPPPASPDAAAGAAELLHGSPDALPAGWLEGDLAGGTVRFATRRWLEDAAQLDAALALLRRVAAAAELLRALGDGALAPLHAAAREAPEPTRDLAHAWLDEVLTRDPVDLGGAPTDHLCVDCLTRFVDHRREHPVQGDVRYVACRTCHRRDRRVPGPALARLDDGGSTLVRELGGGAVVEWTRCRRPFDFTRVEIRSASDADIEAFAIQCANDDDPGRAVPLREVSVHLAPGSDLAPNTRAILERTFAAVLDGELSSP